MKEHFEEYMKEHVKVHAQGNPQHMITSYLQNGKFIGFPSMAIKIEDKRMYVAQMDNKLLQELWTHICEWHGIVKAL